MNNITHVPTGKTFKITTISELAAVATDTNIDFLMADLKLAIVGSKAIGKMHAAVFPEAIPFNEMVAFEWLDDGKNELSAVKFVDEKGDEQFRINKDSFKDMEGE